VNIFLAEINNEEAVLGAEESLHCCRVLRKKKGERIKLIDGKGWFYEAELLLVSDKKCIAKIIEPPTFQKGRDYYIHLAIAPTKQIDRIEWMLEKIVEFGVDEISLIRCRNSERTQVNPSRLKKIIESAVKQSLQSRIPVLNELLDFQTVVSNSKEQQKFIAHCEEGEKTELKEVPFKNQKTIVLIGPEGDFSEEEINIAQHSNFKALNLGANRLRTETAGLSVIMAAVLNG